MDPETIMPLADLVKEFAVAYTSTHAAVTLISASIRYNSNSRRFGSISYCLKKSILDPSTFAASGIFSTVGYSLYHMMSKV